YPLFEQGLIDSPVYVDAKSGISGAGRTPTESNTFMAVNDDIRPYKIGNHRHRPEILQWLPSEDVGLTFTPHVISAERGIESAIYTALSETQDPGSVKQTMKTVCEDHEMLRYRSEPAGLKAVARTPYADLTCVVDNRAVRIFSYIDNLCKGAATQAIQNANLMLDLPINRGLIADDG
ncbi:MAG: Asd/ArgC dimerization domain-containing protein, partial [bacterium]